MRFASLTRSAMTPVTTGIVGEGLAPIEYPAGAYGALLSALTYRPPSFDMAFAGMYRDSVPNDADGAMIVFTTPSGVNQTPPLMYST